MFARALTGERARQHGERDRKRLVSLRRVARVRSAASGDEIQQRHVSPTSPRAYLLPLLLTVIIFYAKRSLSRSPPHSFFSPSFPSPSFVRVLPLTGSPRPCLAPVSSAGSGPFVSPAWSAISIHSFLPLRPPAVSPRKDVFSLAYASSFPVPHPRTRYISAVSSLHPAIPPSGTTDRLHVPFLEVR